MLGVINQIRHYRELAMLTQDDLAKKLKTSLHSVWRWENNKVEPRASELSQMAEIFGCSIDELLAENPPPPSAQLPEEPGTERKTA